MAIDCARQEPQGQRGADDDTWWLNLYVMFSRATQMEDMQLLLLTYREDLIAAKLGKERAEEKLRSDVTQLKGLLVSEQQSKAGVERQLRGEIHDLHSKVATLEEIR